MCCAVDSPAPGTAAYWQTVAYAYPLPFPPKKETTQPHVAKSVRSTLLLLTCSLCCAVGSPTLGTAAHWLTVAPSQPHLPCLHPTVHPYARSALTPTYLFCVVCSWFSSAWQRCSLADNCTHRLPACHAHNPGPAPWARSALTPTYMFCVLCSWFSSNWQRCYVADSCVRSAPTPPLLCALPAHCVHGVRAELTCFVCCAVGSPAPGISAR